MTAQGSPGSRPADGAAAVVGALGPLLAAEAMAEASGAAVEAGDLEQAVWVRLFERLDGAGPPADPAGWVRGAVRAEVRRARRRAARERVLALDAAVDPGESVEGAALRAETGRAVRSAVARTPGDCPRLLSAMLSSQDPTYREIAGELNLSQGSLGPKRSRCLGCLRRMLAAEVAAPVQGGRVR
ncbi:RNA polymerase sigma factor [Streptomyces sp. NPDC058953]|uniref:RNA polymerase sigma factor n=1 Tax=unclassified Streptomyces TaxID=2593676 RepID=UPI0036C5C970